MYSKVGFERVGDFSEIWPAFCRASAHFGAYAPSELRLDIGPDELLAELQRASAAASTRAEAEGSPGVTGFDVRIQGAGVSVTFGGGRSFAHLSCAEGQWTLLVGSRADEECLDAWKSVCERWKAAGFPLPR